MTDITQILVGLIIILLGVYVSFVRPWLRTKLSPEQLSLLRQFSRVAVYAAEQIITITTGKDKKEYAVGLVKQLLAKYGLTFDEDVVSAAIEEQVFEMNKDKEKKDENSESK